MGTAMTTLFALLAALAFGAREGRAAPSISSGYAHTCAALNGAAYCWGNNANGQLGRGFVNDPSQPGNAYVIQPNFVSGLTSGVTAVSAGDQSSCAIVNSGLKCWGANDHGQLGTGNTTPSTTPVDVVGLTAGVTDLSVGLGYACAVQNSKLFCWGRGDFGALGTGDRTDRPSPVQIAPQFGVFWQRVTAGAHHACGLFGPVGSTGAYCWGTNSSGQVGNNSTMDALTPVPVLNGGVVTDVSAGFDVTCRILSVGSVVQCWGDNTNYRAGNENRDTPGPDAEVPGPNSNIPRTVSFPETSTAVELSQGSHALGMCAKTNFSNVYCWGDNKWGALGNGLQYFAAGGTIPLNKAYWGFDANRTNLRIPDFVSGFALSTYPTEHHLTTGNITGHVTMGYHFSCAITNFSPAMVSCWGNGDTYLGQLGSDFKYMLPDYWDVPVPTNPLPAVPPPPPPPPPPNCGVVACNPSN
jgi:alpha-tubulin suppressor-like RCC1 family protein